MKKSDKNIQKKYDNLDGFRGILAISVVFQHTRQALRLGGDYELTMELGYYFAVPSFLC
jgi:peptidoglycan/LPS O-acetylase OafA/YrhL